MPAPTADRRIAAVGASICFVRIIQEIPFGAKLKCDVFLIMYLISAARYTNAFILSYTLKKAKKVLCFDD
jgi:hypothetical protein